MIPQVSIGLPVYNGEKYLEFALESILSQDFKDFELIISNNASTDNTHKICMNYSRRDNRIRYFHNPENIGSAPNYEKVVKFAKAKYFKWHAHDDIIKPGFLRTCLSTFEREKSSTVLVYPKTELIDENGKVIGVVKENIDQKGYDVFRKVIFFLWNVRYGSALNGLLLTNAISNTMLSNSGLYWDLPLLFDLSLTGNIVEIPETLIQQRVHNDNALASCSIKVTNSTVNNPKMANKQTMKELLIWENPKNKGRKFILPAREALCLEFLNRIIHKNLSYKYKCTCIIPAVITWYLRHLKNFVGSL